MDHLNQDSILDIIASNTLIPEVKKHLSNCDKCFNQYVSIKSNYLEIQHAKIEQTPEKYVKALNKKFNIGYEPLSSRIFSKINSQIRNIINFPIDLIDNVAIMRPQLMGVAIIPIMLIMFLYIAPIEPINNTQIVYRSIIKQTIEIDDLSKKNHVEIVKYAKDYNINLKLNFGGEKFSQSPLEGTPFNILADTLEVNLPASLGFRIKYWGQKIYSTF
tara:strand:+ start:2581 stop:3231 length:651 start_codon:yes stop_codon:yes gene_type:complete